MGAKPKKIADDQQRRLLSRIAQYALRHKGVIVIGLLSMLVYNICRQFPIWATGQLIDRVISLDVNKLRETQTKHLDKIHRLVDAYAKNEPIDPVVVEKLRAKRKEMTETGNFRKAIGVLTADEKRIDELHDELRAITSANPPSREVVQAHLRDIDARSGAAENFSPDRMLWLSILCGAIIGVAAIGAVLYFVNEFIFKWLATRVVVELRAELMRHMMRMPLRFFHTRKMGDLHSRLTNDVQATFQTVNIFMSEIIMEPMTIAATVATAVTASWRLSLFILVLVPVVIYPVVRLGKRVKKTAKKGYESLGDTTEVMMQSMSGIRIVKAFRGEEAEIKRFLRYNEEYLRRNISLVRTKARGRGTMDFLYSAALGLFLFFGGYLLVNDMWDLTAGGLVTFMTAIGMIYRPIRKLAQGYGDFQESLAASSRIFELLDAEPEPKEDGTRVQVKRIESGIVFENVTFSYDPKLGAVLDNVSFEIKRGQTVALVGKSGSGKSTTADLLARFYKPVRGRILIDGVDLDLIDKESYLDRIAIVSQQPFVFNTTVKENILYGRPTATMEEIHAAAKAANIHAVIEALPNGYDTVVGERGATLSGGELQRVTIARAILRNADLLILDEATSSLDSHSERLVQDALDRLTHGRTALVIAHRLSTVQKADRIVVLDRGTIQESGTHAELLKLNGRYAALYATQFGKDGGDSTETGNYPLFA